MIGGSGASQTTLEILDEVFGGYDEMDFKVRLWDDTIWPADPPASSAFTLVLNHPAALRQMFLPPSDLNLGEVYIYGDFDVKGDLIAAFPLVSHFET